MKAKWEMMRQKESGGGGGRNTVEIEWSPLDYGLNNQSGILGCQKAGMRRTLVDANTLNILLSGLIWELVLENVPQSPVLYVDITDWIGNFKIDIWSFQLMIICTHAMCEVFQSCYQQWHTKPSQIHSTPPQWCTNSSQRVKTSTNAHKLSWDTHNTSSMTHKTSTERLQTTTALLSLLAGDGRVERMNRDEQWRRAATGAWRESVSIYHLYIMKGIKPDISAEYWWSLFVSPERADEWWTELQDKTREEPGAENVGRGTSCWGRRRCWYSGWTTISWTESWFPVIKFRGLTFWMGDPSVSRASVTSAQSSKNSEKTKRNIASDYRAASVLRLWDSWTSSTKQTALVSVRLWCNIKWVKLVLQAWCCQMFSIRSAGNVHLILEANRLTLSAVTVFLKLTHILSFINAETSF